MIGNLIRTHIKKNREFILDEARFLDGFMKLLMKERNTGRGWSKSEKAHLRGYIVRLAWHVPVLCLVLLPFGSLVIPLLAEIVDRRKRSRNRPDEGPGGGGVEHSRG